MSSDDQERESLRSAFREGLRQARDTYGDHPEIRAVVLGSGFIVWYGTYAAMTGNVDPMAESIQWDTAAKTLGLAILTMGALEVYANPDFRQSRAIHRANRLERIAAELPNHEICYQRGLVM